MTLSYTYFNRPGATIQTHNDAVFECWIQAVKTKSYDEKTPVAAGGLIGALASSALQHAYHHGAVGASLENCMVALGWRVVSIADAEGADLAKLPPGPLSMILAPWVGAQTPHGDVVRTWGNDAAHGTSTRFSFRPDHKNDGQLSLIAATGHDLTKFNQNDGPTAVNDYPAPDATLDKRWSMKPLKANKLSAASPDGGVIITRVRGLGLNRGTTVFFNRMGSRPDIWASNTDHMLDSIGVYGNPFYQGKNGAWVAWAVPAGRWRVFSIAATSKGELNFCLGSPSFEVKAGDVIYAGTFDFTGELGPDLDLAPAKAWLGGAPQANTVKAAQYTNGSLGPCGGDTNGIYALEIDGAPFAPGYEWGGKAAAATQTPAPVGR